MHVLACVRAEWKNSLEVMCVYNNRVSGMENSFPPGTEIFRPENILLMYPEFCTLLVRHVISSFQS